MKIALVISWACRLVAGLILLQTLFFKFSASPESVYIFSTLGVEPWGRIATGCLEALASVLLLWPQRAEPGWQVPFPVLLGAGLALGLMAGAIASHLLVLGIESQGDGGQLFFYALLVAAASVTLLLLHRRQLFQWFSYRFSRV